MDTREGGEGQHFGFGLIHVGPDLGDAGGELVTDLFPAGGDGGGVGLGEDRAEQRRDHVHLVLGHHGEQVAGEMDPAPLMPHTVEGACDRGHQAGVLIGDDELHSGQASALQMGEELAPEHLVLAVADIQPEDLPPALAGDPGGDHDRFAGDQPAATDMQVGGIQEHVRVAGGVEPAGPEPTDFLVQTGTDPRHLGLRDPRPAQGDDQVVDVTGRDPVHPRFHDHRVQGLVDPTAGLQHRGEERPDAQFRDRQLHRAGLRHQLPRPRAVALGDPLRAPFVAAGADHLGGLNLDQFLEHEPDRLANQINAVTGTECVQQLRHGRIRQGHR